MSYSDTLTLSGTNCYLLKVRNGYLLIDCGSLHDKDGFLRKIKEIGIKPTDICYLLLTHHHNDHCGLLELLTAANPQIKIIMSRKCAEYMQTGKHFRHDDERYANQALHLIVGTYIRLGKNNSFNFTPYFARETDILIQQDNESILPQLGIEGRILLTPGHTEDSISMVTGNSAYVGDAARNLLNFTGAPYEPVLLYDRGTCRKSWQKLMASGAEIIYPGHGRSFNMKNLATSIE